MTENCPCCGDPIVAGHSVEPGIEQFAPCGCRVATDGGETAERSVDGGDR